MEDLINKGYMRQFIAQDRRARLEPVRDKRDRSQSSPVRGWLERDHRSQLADSREVWMDSQVTREILVISGGPTKRDSANSSKASLKRVRHKVMADTLQSNPERPYSLSFSLDDRHNVVKPHVEPLVVLALVSSFKIWRILVDTCSMVDILF